MIKLSEKNEKLSFTIDGVEDYFTFNFNIIENDVNIYIGSRVISGKYYDFTDESDAPFPSVIELETLLSIYSQDGKDSIGLTDSELRATPIETTVNKSQDFGIDASGRTRISQITTLLDGKTLGSDDSDLFENIGSGTAAFSANKVNLSVTSGQYIVRQSRRFCPYFSGKNQLIEATCDDFETQAGITKRIGYFSSSAVAPYTSNLDGFFFEDNGVKKTFYAYRDGVVTLQKDFVEMDGYQSASTYNWSNFTVMAFDFLWLGGAVLRMWIKTDLGFVLLHTFNYAGSAQDVFILSPNQPIRYEVRSNSGVGSLHYICSQVATEGSIDEAGKTLSLFNATSISTNTVGVIYALKSVKKQAAFRDVAMQILDVSVGITASTDSGILMLIINPTLSAPIVYANKSKIQEGTPTNQTITINTGRVVCAVPINVAGSTDIIKENFLSFLSGSIANAMDEYVLAYMPTTNNQTVHGVLTIKEF
jgi:hypothetical protein